MAKIIIFSGPIRSGKTSALMKSFADREDSSGFLCPDINEIRHFYDLNAKEFLPFQVAANQKDSTLTIGRFVFLTSIFNKAHDILSKGPSNSCNYFIVDEIGKLELKNQGFEPALSHLVASWKLMQSDSKLIVVVRDFLLEEVITKYQLESAEIIKNILEVKL